MKKMKDKVIFGYDNNGTNIEWYWSDQDKQYWKTWKPKVKDVLVIGLTNKKEKRIIQQEIWEGYMESEHPKKEKLTGMYKERGYK